MDKKKRRLNARNTATGVAFIMPSLIGFLVFTFVPVLISLFLSFCDWNFMSGFEGIKFNGLQNYIKLFSDDWFLASYRNNITFTVVTVPCLIALGLLIATIMNKYIFGGGAVRTMFFIPYICSVVAVCSVWMVLFQPSYGPINQLLFKLGMENPPKWLADYDWSLVSIMIVYIWQQVGYYAIVFLAAIKGVPDELYEAASLDGAGAVRSFFNVTVPMVAPTTFFLAIMGIIGSFKVFDQISVLTQGGPGNSSSVMAFYVYRTAFEYYNMGYANTLAWALFVLIFAVTMVQWKLQDKFTNE